MPGRQSLPARLGSQLARVTGRRAPTARIAVVLVSLVTAGSVLTACAASAGDLARASCVHVNNSLKLLDQAQHSANPATAASLRAKANAQLLAAIPIAAQAAYHDVQWESLSATLSESNRVPEAELIPSLKAQCLNATSSVFNQPPPPANPAAG